MPLYHPGRCENAHCEHQTPRARQLHAAYRTYVAYVSRVLHISLSIVSRVRTQRNTRDLQARLSCAPRFVHLHRVKFPYLILIAVLNCPYPIVINANQCSTGPAGKLPVERTDGNARGIDELALGALWERNTPLIRPLWHTADIYSRISKEGNAAKLLKRRQEALVATLTQVHEGWNTGGFAIDSLPMANSLINVDEERRSRVNSRV